MLLFDRIGCGHYSCHVSRVRKLAVSPVGCARIAGWPFPSLSVTAYGLWPFLVLSVSGVWVVAVSDVMPALL